MRGMVISVAGLSWFGLGLYLGPECEPLRDKAIKLLRRLRTKGPLSCSDLRRNMHLKKQERDALLARLEEEHLVRIDDKRVVATTYGDFVEALYGREEFPQVRNHWAEFQEQLKAGAKQNA